MSRFWCEKHEEVVDETGCMQCIAEDAGEEMDEDE